MGGKIGKHIMLSGTTKPNFKALKRGKGAACGPGKTSFCKSFSYTHATISLNAALAVVNYNGHLSLVNVVKPIFPKLP